MIRIITVRHAQTEFSLQKRIAGKLDVPISTEGLIKAKAVKPYFDSIGHDFVISSGLQRALQTAKFCTGLPIGEIEVRFDCSERDFGNLQGLTPEEVSQINGEVEYVKVGEHHHSLNPPGGETLNALRLRAKQFKTYLVDHFAEKSVVVFSHHTFLQQFHGSLAGRDTLECMASDIQPLEFNFFQLDSTANLIKHSIRRPIVDHCESW